MLYHVLNLLYIVEIKRTNQEIIPVCSLIYSSVFIFLFLSSIKYREGITRKVKIVDIANPPIIVKAMGLNITPPYNVSGIKPHIVVITDNIIGRVRLLIDFIQAVIISVPFDLSVLM